MEDDPGLTALYRHGANTEKTRFREQDGGGSFADELRRRQAQVSHQKRRRPEDSGSDSGSSFGFNPQVEQQREPNYPPKRSRDHQQDQHHQNSHGFDDIESNAEPDESMAHRKSKEELEAEQMSMYAELKRMERSGSVLTRRIDENTPYLVLQVELDIQRQNEDEDQKVFIMKLLLHGICRGFEWVVCKVKFVKLEGWAASACADMKKYDPVLRRIYRKVFPKGAGGDPFMELGIMLAISAVTFHFTAGIRSQFQIPDATTVPSNANPFMDQNTPTGPTGPTPPPQTKSSGGGGGGLMNTIMSAMGGGGEGNPIGQILGMFQNGQIGDFMKSAQNYGQNQPPGGPPSMDMNGPPPGGYAPQRPSRPAPPFDERTGRYAQPNKPNKPNKPRPTLTKDDDNDFPPPPSTNMRHTQHRRPVLDDVDDDDDDLDHDVESIYGPSTTPAIPSRQQHHPDETSSSNTMATMDFDSDED